MKRIIFNTDSLIMGGAEKLAIQYIKELCKDYQITLLINEDNGEKGNILEKDIPINIEKKFIVDKKIMEKINQYRELKKICKYNLWYKIMYNHFLKERRKSFRKNIVEYLKNEKYDILIDFCCKIPIEAVDERTITWIHLSLEGMKSKSIKYNTEKFEKVKKVVVINDDMKQEFNKLFPTCINKAERIYNFFNIKDIENKSLDKSLLSEEERKKINDKYIVACCRLDRQKDLETLIKAFSNLKNKYSIQEKLYIVGDGDKRKELEDLVKSLKLTEEIIFLGTQKNPYVWMKNAEYFVHSSHREGFGMVIVEAMITNGLVISSDCPVGPREILEDGKSGILVKLQNVEEMEKALYNALTDCKLQKEKREAAAKRIEEFSTEKKYLKIVNIIEE